MAGNEITQLSKLQRNADLVKDHISGATYEEMRAKYDVSNASISRILSKVEVQDLINTALNHLATFAPLIVRNYRTLLNSDSEKIKLAATQALAEILGVRPTHNQSQITLQFNTQHNTTIISDQMREIIDKISGNTEFVDAEFESILAD